MDDFLALGVVVTYRIILPVLVGLGLLGSAASILVLSRPKLSSTLGNKYFLALSWCDLFLCLSYIIICVTACGCVFNNRAAAWFFAHLGWSITCSFHTVGTYIIIFMSLDRFVAVWLPVWYERLTKSRCDITCRLVGTAVVGVAIHIPYMVDAEVQCVERYSVDECSAEVHHEDNCTSNTFISNDGFQKSYDEPWHVAFRYMYGIMVRWLPCALLVCLNLGLVLAVVRGRLDTHLSSTEKTKNSRRYRKKRLQERVLMATAIAMTTSYVVLSIPITVFLSAYAEHSECRCERDSPTETLRHVGNVTQLLEHLLHGVYLVLINPSFRKELMHLIQCHGSNRDDSTTDDYSIPSGGRPLSTASRSSKACKDSISHGLTTYKSMTESPTIVKIDEEHSVREYNESSDGRSNDGLPDSYCGEEKTCAGEASPHEGRRMSLCHINVPNGEESLEKLHSDHHCSNIEVPPPEERDTLSNTQTTDDIQRSI